MDGDGYVPRQVAWDDDKDRVLRELWPTHVATEIARTMHRMWPAYNWSKNVIIGRARRLDLELKKPAAWIGPRVKRQPPSPPPPILRDYRTPVFDFSPPEPDDDCVVIPLHAPSRARAFPGEDIEPAIGTATIQGVGSRQCRFPMWGHDETGAPDFPLCGAETQAGSSYCPTHHAVCWRPAPRKLDRKLGLFVIGDNRNSLISLHRKREPV